MTELAKPITRLADIEAKTPPDEETFCFDVGGGGHLQIPSSATPGGSGYQLNANLCTAPNVRDIYGLGAQLSFDQNEERGSEFALNKDQKYSRYFLTLSRGQKSFFGEDSEGRATLTHISSKNLHIGFSAKALELGNDFVSEAVMWRPSGRFGMVGRLYAGTFSGIPFDSDTAETTRLYALRAGADFHLALADNATKPAPEGNTPYDFAYYMTSGLHRFFRSYGTAKAIAGPSEEVQEYTQELFGEGEVLPSARLEDLGFINIFSLRGEGSEDSVDAELELNAKGDQAGWMLGRRLVLGAAYFGMSASDDSTTMATQGFASTFGALRWWIAEGLDLNLTSRRTLSQSNQQKKAAALVGYSTLLHAVGFGIGWATDDSKAGQALVKGAMQATLSLSLNPDPARTGLATQTSRHGFYEWVKGKGKYVGYKQTTYLPYAHLYTNTRLAFQTTPGPIIADEFADQVTERDTLYQGAKAAASAGIGFEAQTGPVSWSAGVRAALAYGEGPEPLPGAGLEGQMLFTFGEETRFEFGAGVSGDYLDGEFQPAVNVLSGLRF